MLRVHGLSTAAGNSQSGVRTEQGEEKGGQGESAIGKQCNGSKMKYQRGWVQGPCNMYRE